MPTLSLCMIVRNEEKFLANCLNSVKDLVDEIIIVDTGSADKTKEIATSFGAKVFPFEWCDDFSAARNESLRYATSDWILVLDADETIAKNDHEKIKSLITSSDIGGYILTQRNYFSSYKDLSYGSFNGLNVTAAGQSDTGFFMSKNDSYNESQNTVGWIPTPIVRLFKAGKDIAFTGIVHEDVSPSINPKIVPATVPIHHFGKMDTLAWQKKWDLYEKLAEKKAKRENDYYAYFELGRQYLENKKIAEARKMFERSISVNDKYWLSWFNLGTIHLIEQHLEEAEKCLTRAKELNPNAAVIYGNLGVVQAKKKEYQAAIETFVLGLNLDATRADIFKNMGFCYANMGDTRRARLAFTKAIELNPQYKHLIKHR